MIFVGSLGHLTSRFASLHIVEVSDSRIFTAKEFPFRFAYFKLKCADVVV